jgi:hypothetical protein
LAAAILSASVKTGSVPAVLQWTFNYPAANVSALSATADLALLSSDNTIICVGSTILTNVQPRRGA